MQGIFLNFLTTCARKLVDDSETSSFYLTYRETIWLFYLVFELFRFWGNAMLLLHLFKLPHNDTERNQVPTLLWLHDNIVPVF